MHLLTLDFETFYDPKDDYTLRKMTTHEYIVDERFQAQSVSIKIDDGDAIVVPHEHIEHALQSIDWREVALIGHNLKFDGYILAYHYGVVPALYLDTMSMALATIGGRLDNASLGGVAGYLGIEAKQRAGALKDVQGVRWEDMSDELKRELMLYNRDDVEQTYEVFKRLFPLFPKEELPSLDWTIRAACLPQIMLDEKLLDDEVRDVRRRNTELIKKSGYTRAQLSSNQKFADVLRELGVEPPVKVSPTTGKTTYDFSKTSEEFLALKDHPEPLVRAVVEARLAVKSTIAETRAAKMLRLAKLGKPVPAPLTFSGAIQTHRYSGAGGLNFQNIPKKGLWWDKKKKEWVKKPSRLRLAVMAPPGKKIVVADSSNIELRVCHWLANEREVFDVIAAGGDPYCAFASAIYGVEVNPKAYEDGSDERAKHDRMRTLGKIAMLALQYGMGANKYIHTVWSWTGMQIDPDEAQRVVDAYRTRYANIYNMWYAYDQILRYAAQGMQAQLPPPFNNPFTFHWAQDDDGNLFEIEMPWGLRIRYPGLRLHQDENGEELRFLKRYKRTKDKPYDYTWGGKCVENCTQGLSSAIIRYHMRNVAKRLKQDLGLGPEVMPFQVHDEVVAVVPESVASDVLDVMLEEMSKAPDWATGLVLSAEGDIADRYGEAK